MSDNATKEDIARVEKSVGKAHERIDKVVDQVSDINADVSHMRGCVDGMCTDVGVIEDALVKGATTGGANNPELYKTLRYLIIAVMLGAIVAAGWSSLSGSAGNTKVEASK